jgi:O-antigen/teichoic acid export membrane protein
MGGLNFGASGLIVGNIIGQFLSTLYLFKKVYHSQSRPRWMFNKLKTMALLKKYKKLPLLNLPNVLIDNFRLSGINILIAKFFTTATLGQFALAWKMVQTPMGVIGRSLAQVFFQKIASVKRDELYGIIKSFIVKASLVALPIFAIIYLFSVDIFMFVFGKNWSLAGESASIMSPWLFLNFLTSPLSQIFIVLNKQEIMLTFSIFYMAIPLSIIYFFRDLGFVDVLSLVTLSMSIMLLLFIGMVLFYAKKEEGLKV